MAKATRLHVLRHNSPMSRCFEDPVRLYEVRWREEG